jgi:hypothetical protein
MLSNIAKDKNFSNASFANRKTAKYWNQVGFLRVLKDDNLDGWFLHSPMVIKKSQQVPKLIRMIM